MNTPTVLIVEDDENLRTLYKDAFEAAGIIVLAAAGGREGLALALKHHPEAILLDIMMPDMNGHDVAEKLRLDSWGKKAVIIFLTNMSDAENVVQAVEKGSSEYIIKANVPPKEVVNRVRMAMKA